MTDEPPAPVRLILDRSALEAYLSGSVHVGEPLHEVIQDGNRFGVPVIVAAETLAAATGKDLTLLHWLLALPACAVLPQTGDDLLELTYWRRTTGRLDLAAAAVAGLTYAAGVLTREGTRYGDGGVPVIYLPGTG